MMTLDTVILRTRQKFPLQLILRETLLQGQSLEISAGSFGGSSDKVLIFETVKYATVIIATLPILMLNPFLQKHFVKGVMIGAIKG